MDVFENKLICKNCEKEMVDKKLIKDGFLLRAKVCPVCNERVIHPRDELEYERFSRLKKKEFRVKMRIVGNSYAISIPKEVVSFMEDKEKILNSMVKLCFENINKLSLSFDELRSVDKNA